MSGSPSGKTASTTTPLISSSLPVFSAVGRHVSRAPELVKVRCRARRRARKTRASGWAARRLRGTRFRGRAAANGAPARLRPCRHTVGVIEASDVRGDEGRMHCPTSVDALDGLAGQLPVTRDRSRPCSIRAGRRSSRSASGESTPATIATGFGRRRCCRDGPVTARDHARGDDDRGGRGDLQGAKRPVAAPAGGPARASGAGRSRRAARGRRRSPRCPGANARQAAQRPQMRVEQRGLELGELAVGAQRRPGAGALAQVRFRRASLIQTTPRGGTVSDER